MKEFKLTGWPDLAVPYQRAAYRRAVSDMSNRHVSARHLASACGLSRAEVQAFLDDLRSRGLLHERTAVLDESLMTTLRPWGGRLMRVLTTDLTRL